MQPRRSLAAPMEIMYATTAAADVARRVDPIAPPRPSGSRWCCTPDAGTPSLWKEGPDLRGCFSKTETKDRRRYTSNLDPLKTECW